MLGKLSMFAVLLALADVSRSSEVSQKNLINSEVFSKKLLPSVKHLLKEGNDGNRQKFLRMLDGLDVDGYKKVSGESNESCPGLAPLAIHTMLSSRMQLTHFSIAVINNPKAPADLRVAVLH